MTARCDRCGHPAADAAGERQASLFDLPEADPRATTAARAELRAGRILCPACQRTGELFPAAVVVPVVTAPHSPFPRPVVDHWTSQAEEAERIDAVADMDDDPPVRTRKRGWQDRTSRIARTPNAEVWAPWALAWAYGVDDGRNGMHVPPAAGPADRDPEEWKAYRAGVAAGVENRKNPKSGAWDSGFRAPRNKNWRGDAKAEAWDRARAAGRR